MKTVKSQCIYLRRFHPVSVRIYISGNCFASSRSGFFQIRIAFCERTEYQSATILFVKTSLNQTVGTVRPRNLRIPVFGLHQYVKPSSVRMHSAASFFSFAIFSFLVKASIVYLLYTKNPHFVSKAGQKLRHASNKI